MARKTLKIADYVMPLLMNRLQGRMLALPASRRRRREFLVIYGQHASLEHWWPLALELSEYGNVTMPDLPGFGGMESFYKINQKPTVDALADYLAAFVKLRYKHKRFVIVGVAFGFVVVTRMLERYPALAKKVDLAISIGGMAHHEDLTYSRINKIWRRLLYRGLSFGLPALFVRNVCLHPFVLKQFCGRWTPEDKKHHHADISDEEIKLWRRNGLRTHLFTAAQLMSLDNCQKRAIPPLWHVAMPANHLLDHHHVLQHLHVIYPQVLEFRSRIKANAVGTFHYNSAAALLPAELRRRLGR